MLIDPSSFLRQIRVGILVTALVGSVAAGVDSADVAARLRQMSAGHPRLFLDESALPALRQRTLDDPAWARLRAGVVAEGNRLLSAAPVERVLIGRRLLDKSRTCLSRILNLGLAWRLTGEQKYADRARAELIAVAAFADWNPAHFLDVAEMTAGVGIGYDWFWPALDEPTRVILRQAIVSKGLQASLSNSGWSRLSNNWNQVCNGGITVGALAVAESDPDLAAKLVARAINTVPLAMHEYGPDGAYPEGPSYWGYGTTYNLILISALQSALGTDFGLSQQPGFMATADYQLHAAGPTGQLFNYSDSKHGIAQVQPAIFWFAAARRESFLLWSEWPKLQDPQSGVTFSGDNLVMPLLMLWMSPTLSKPAEPPALSWTGGGKTPVAFHRSSWDRDASYVAIKGGSPKTGHAHMDVGSFVMDADGVRWADDLGLQNYNSLESKGVNLWSSGQDGGRWKVFRIGTSAHNVLMVDGAQQRVDSQAPIILQEPNRTVVDLGGTYHGQLQHARRGAELRPDRTVLMQDEVTALDRPTSIRWAMLTQAEVRIDGPGQASLTQAGQTLRFRVLEPAGVALKVYPTDPPPSDYDARNEGTRLIGFEIAVPPAQARRLVVHLVPGSAKPAEERIHPLAQW